MIPQVRRAYGTAGDEVVANNARPFTAEQAGDFRLRRGQSAWANTLSESLMERVLINLLLNPLDPAMKRALAMGETNWSGEFSKLLPEQNGFDSLIKVEQQHIPLASNLGALRPVSPSSSAGAARRCDSAETGYRRSRSRVVEECQKTTSKQGLVALNHTADVWRGHLGC